VGCAPLPLAPLTSGGRVSAARGRRRSMRVASTRGDKPRQISIVTIYLPDLWERAGIELR